MKTNLSFFDKLMVTVTFAEANAAGTVPEFGPLSTAGCSGRPLLDKKDTTNTLSHGMASTEANA
ncbi:MAG: hypothetical protein A2521_10065 [Deltaproteobacteria bacterium RIFOXYD12_FULL_57_12]|nr:MAG: hypothetical protein A2521_10065 [Deltaproteobacteria bacterium RIFOXYD12_FULL_57_12]